jgi:hypothetical protein
LEFNLNINGVEKHDGSGDAIAIEEFVECCEDGSFIDYDGFADELLLNGVVVWRATTETNEWLYPSDVLYAKSKLLKLAKENKGLEIVWYNR